MNTPLVSVVIPCFNSALWIGEAIDSCFTQLYAAVEIIVVDDGSTDRSVEVIATHLAQMPNVSKVLCQSNQGAPAARNAGIEVATGELVAFLDADDYFFPGGLEALIGAMQPDVDVVFGDVRFVDAQKHPNGVRVQAPVGDDWVVFAIETGAHGPRLFRRRVLQKCPWKVALPCVQDYELLLNCAANGFVFRHVPQIVAEIRLHESPTRISVKVRKSAIASETRVSVNLMIEDELVQRCALTPARKAALHYSLLADAMLLWRLGKREAAGQLFRSIETRMARRSGCFGKDVYARIAAAWGIGPAGWAWSVRQHLQLRQCGRADNSR